MIRYALIALAVVAIFFFPWPYAALLAFIAALFVPVFALAAGILYDALYFSHPAAAFPYATLLGVIGFLVAFFLRRFIKARFSDFSYPSFR